MNYITQIIIAIVLGITITYFIMGIIFASWVVTSIFDWKRYFSRFIRNVTIFLIYIATWPWVLREMRRL